MFILENIDLVIFDFDGTLVDSLDDLVDSLNLALDKAGCKTVDPVELKMKLCLGSSSLLDDLIGDQRVLKKTVFGYYKEFYQKNMFNRTKLYDGALEVLQKLSKHKKLSLLTNKREATTRTMLSHFQLDHFFLEIIGGDTLDEKKPSPKPIFHICEKLNVSPERTVMIGDSHADIKAGKSARAKTIGFINGFSTREMLEACQPDVFIESLAEIL
ncbi:MAG: HAD family hydrolase [Bdellovibrionales bacterium]|nr:HAD family hydrolase [Bdellovibrionales bacterium]